MDYSPSPARVQPQYAFLDNSVELGRAERARVSPLKGRDESLNNLQRRFFHKYSEFKPEKAKKEDTTDRLFRNVGRVPVDDGVKINSNMVEKTIRENERLKAENETLRDERDLAQRYAKGLREKLIKYKQLNDKVKQDLEDLQQNAKVSQNGEQELRKAAAELRIENQRLNEMLSHKQNEPEFNFNPEKTHDIFGEPEILPVEVPPPSTNNAASADPARTSKIEERIKSLEARVSQMKDKDDERFEYIKNEMQFLRTLVTPQQIPTPRQSRRPSVQEEEHSATIKEDEWVLRETVELNELQNEISRVQHKLQLREDNMKKKSELKRQLGELNSRLEVQETPVQHSQEESPQQKSEQGQAPTRCDVCDASDASDITVKDAEQPHIIASNGAKWY